MRVELLCQFSLIIIFPGRSPAPQIGREKKINPSRRSHGADETVAATMAAITTVTVAATLAATVAATVAALEAGPLRLRDRSSLSQIGVQHADHSLLVPFHANTEIIGNKLSSNDFCDPKMSYLRLEVVEKVRRDSDHLFHERCFGL